MSPYDLYLSKARENIEAADLLIKRDYIDIAVSRHYYAVFYLAEALLDTKNLSFSSHSAVIAAFGKEFAKTGILNNKHHKHLREAFELRQVGDYTLEKQISKDRAEMLLSWAEEFYTDAEKYFSKLGLSE